MVFRNKIIPVISSLILSLIPISSWALCGDRVCETGEDTYNCAYDCGLVVDHHAVLQFGEIPEEWITAAKEFTIHYAHASHGDQINDGLIWLEGVNPKYSFAIRRDNSTAALPLPENPPEIRMFSGNPPNDPMAIAPGSYYNSASGLISTRNVASTGDFNFSMFSWCSQMCYFSLAQMDEYNIAMNNFETEFPNMRFIYMTGTWAGNFHASCMDEAPEVEITKVDAMNQRIKDYALAHHKVIYDFRDIETHAPDGTPHPETPDKCSWCDEWCDSHPGDCVNLPTSCDHSRYADYPEGALICVLKGKAFWWMMARLAGWPGVGNTDTTPPIRTSGQPTGTLAGETTQATISVATNENATCMYSASAGVAYDSMTSTFSTTGARSHSSLVTGLANGQTYHYYVRCKDASNNANTDDYGITFSIAMPDSTAPSAITNLSISSCTSNSCSLGWMSPGDDGNTGTASQYDLRYSTSLINSSNFASATQASGEPTPLAAGTSQSMTVSGLAPSTTYYFAVKARDEASNWSGISNVPSMATQDAPDNIPPVISNGTPSGELPESTVEATVSVNTSENATCKYSTTAGTAYISMTNAFTNTGEINHSTLVTGLESGESYSFYIRCRDSNGNVNSDDFEISFSVLKSNIDPQINDGTGISVTGGCGVVSKHSKNVHEAMFISLVLLILAIKRRSNAGWIFKH